jgi:RND superfamily putative drug exporter
MISVFAVLFLMTGSILIPIKAVIVSILSLGATFGILYLIFETTDSSIQHTLGIRPNGYMDGSNIIFIFSVAFGLSVDYEEFLLSRVLEEYKILKDIDLAVIHAVQKTGGLITSAAVMLLLHLSSLRSISSS